MLSGDEKIKGIGGPPRPVLEGEVHRKKEEIADKKGPETGDVAAGQEASRTLARKGPDANRALSAASRKFQERVTESDIREARDRLVALRNSGVDGTGKAGEFCADLTNYSLTRHGRIS